MKNRIFTSDRLYPDRRELTRSHSQTLGFLAPSGNTGGGSSTRFPPPGAEANLS